MTTSNPNPNSNPIATTMVASTLINNVQLNPLESYNCVVQKISSKVANIGVYTTVYSTTNDYVKYIKLTSNFCLKIYLPRFNEDQTIYLVPAVFNTLYDDGIQDFTSSAQATITYFDSNFLKNMTWAQGVQAWITTVNYAPTDVQPAVGTNIFKDVKISLIGVDTARMDQIVMLNIRLATVVA